MLTHKIKVAILALEGAAATTIIGPQDIFSMTGVFDEMARGRQPAPLFEVRLVNPDGRAVRCYNNLQITPHCAMDEFDPELILVPGILDIGPTLEKNLPVIRWLQDTYQRGCLLTGVCSGSMLLAATGLLDGRVATTHWVMVNEFRRRYPRVLLQPEEIITEQDRLICSGGFNSCLDVSLYLVEKLAGPSVARQCAKVFLQDLERRSQAPYLVFSGHKEHGDGRILAVQSDLEDHYTEGVDITELAARHGMGRRTMERRFKKATGETPLAYQQRLRVERAKQLLETGTASFDEISYQVGYAESGFFRKLFIKYTSLRPREYRRRFSCIRPQANTSVRNQSMARKKTGFTR